MLASLFGYFFGMLAVLTAAVVFLTSLSNISPLGSERHYPRPAIARPPKQPRRKLSKAELREQAAAAFLAWREGQTAKDK
jgi:hypothetical protein